MSQRVRENETDTDVDEQEQEDVAVPTQSVDRSITLKERMTDNAWHAIGPARYFERDSNGDPVENWNGVFDRVAANVANAEIEFGSDKTVRDEWKGRFERSMRELRFMPNSPTLMNAGLELQQLSACIAGDAPVYTRSGLKPMSSVEVGDEVLTHEGRFKEVTAHWSNGVKETVGLHRGASRVSSYDTKATPDHKFLNEDGSWVRADEIEDAVAPEFPASAPFPETISLSEYTGVLSETKEVVVDDGAVKLRNNPDDGRTAAFDRSANQPTNAVVNDGRLAWLLGLYLAEGDVSGTDLRITLSSDEDKMATRFVDYVESIFDVPVSVSESSHGRWTQYRVSSPFIVDLFATQCGTGVHEKRIPEWVGSAPDTYQESLLDGLIDGDGHRSDTGDRLVLANPTLAYEATLLSRSVGYDANFMHDKTRDLSSHQTSKMYRSTADRTALDNVAREQTGEMEVFDMEVEDDHSFVVGDFVVHNCFVVEPGDTFDEQSEDGRPGINRAQSDASDIFKSGGGVGYAFHHLRQKGARVDSTGGVSSGPLSFMQLYDTTCGTVKQGGKRRGAQMGIMHCQHPDIGRFAVAKRGEDNLTNFNISFGITDELVEAVQNDDTVTLYDPTTRPSENHDLTDGEPADIVPHAAHFYDPQFEDAWNDDFDKPGVGYDGIPVEENFWRDYADTMTTDFSEYRDRIDLEPGEPMELPARFLWQMLVDGAHNNGEPGIFYLDETNRQHSFDVEKHPEHRIHATNPCCVAGDTRIHTDDGMKRIDDLVADDGPGGVVTDSRLDGDRVESSSNAFVTGTDDVYHLQTEEGYSIRLTADHPVRTDDGWVEVQHLDDGEQIHVLNRTGSFGDSGSTARGEVLGWLVGDGHLKHGEERAVLNFYGDDTEISDLMASHANEITRDATGNAEYEISANTVTRSDEEQGSAQTEERIRSERLYEIADESGLTDKKLRVPEDVFTGSESMMAGFLRALFAADGSVQGSHEKGHSIRLGTVSLQLAHEVQELLANFGIYSRVYEERSSGGLTEMPDGRGGTDEYETQALHEVVITSSDMVQFRDKIGFLHDYKADRLEDALDEYVRGPRDRTFTATVESVEHDGHETVYDITEDTTHSFVANGLVVHNSEQPLEQYEACNLGHVNLSLMVKDNAPRFDEFVSRDRMQQQDRETAVNAYLNRALDSQTFESTVETGTRFLDNVVQQSEFPLDDITEQVRSKRKIGLGLMGFHQMLVQMGVEYGSDVSYEFAREIMRRIDAIATEYSHELAKVRGPFTEWEDSKWADPSEYEEWFRQHAHKTPHEVDDRGYLMRNHNVTTIAPTGTTSMIGNTTGGCEPLFQVAYLKNVGDDIQGEENLVEFDDFFLDTLEANGIDVDAVKSEVREQMLDNEFSGADGLTTVPDAIGDLFVTTKDLSAEQHIRMQAAFQEYCDSGISKTINASNDTTHEEVGEAFMLALDLGIKGTTIYRAGSRKEEVKKENVDNYQEETLDEVGEEELVQHLVDQRNLSVKAEHTLRSELGVEPDPDDAERTCDECGSGHLDLSEGCPICMECGFSPCS